MKSEDDDVISNVLHRIAVAETEIEYADTGAGEPVLLIHGGVFADWFVPVAVEAELADYRLIRVRRAGYTRAPAPAHHLTIDDHARHCAALLDHLGLESVHVVGHSSGALVAIALATARPDLVCGLVLVEPARAGGSWPATAEAREQLEPLMEAARVGDLRMAFHAFMSIVCGVDYQDVLDASLGPDGLPKWEDESAFFFTNEIPAVLHWPFDEAAASRVQQRAIVVQGGNSPPLVHQAVAQVADWIPNATIETIAGSDHMLPLRHPEILAAVVARFIRGERRSSGSEA